MPPLCYKPHVEKDLLPQTNFFTVNLGTGKCFFCLWEIKLGWCSHNNEGKVPVPWNHNVQLGVIQEETHWMYSNPLFLQEATHENIIYNTGLAMGSFAPLCRGSSRYSTKVSKKGLHFRSYLFLLKSNKPLTSDKWKKNLLRENVGTFTRMIKVQQQLLFWYESRWSFLQQNHSW